MKKILFIIISLIFLTNNIFGQDTDYLYNKANEFYQQEQYIDAIKQYEEIINHGEVSGELFYNLGNAYYKIDKIGKAILYYEKAKLYIPENENLQFNLKLVNVKVKDRIQMPDDSFLIKIHKKFINLLSLQNWAIIFSSLLLISSLLFFAKSIFVFAQKKIVLNMILSLLMIALFTLYPIYSRYELEELTFKGVMINSYGEVYAAPDAESTKLFNIHEGTLFNILDSDGNWFKIELIDGKQGWLPKSICGEV